MYVAKYLQLDDSDKSFRFSHTQNWYNNGLGTMTE